MQNEAGSIPQISLLNQMQFRIIPSTYPPINFFEELVDADEMEVLWEIESLTNERLRQEAGDISLVKPKDCIFGPGSSIIMASFTHIGKSSRFTDGSYGVYYAGLSLETAICETVYHRERFFAATKEEACEITMRVYEGKILEPFHDIRHPAYSHLHHPLHYANSQAFGKQLREQNAWGILYNSVRDPQGTCIAAFKPKAISIPNQIKHLRYRWNGEKITEVLEVKSLQHF